MTEDAPRPADKLETRKLTFEAHESMPTFEVIGIKNHNGNIRETLNAAGISEDSIAEIVIQKAGYMLEQLVMESKENGEPWNQRWIEAPGVIIARQSDLETHPHVGAHKLALFKTGATSGGPAVMDFDENTPVSTDHEMFVVLKNDMKTEGAAEDAQSETKE